MKFDLIAFISLTFILFTGCNNSSPDIDPTLIKDTQALQTNFKPAYPSIPSFQIMDVEGHTLNLADLKGKKVLVNLWATWCPPCRVEMPSIEKLYQKVNKEKVVFVMLSLDENFDLPKQFVKANKLQLPIYYPSENLPAMFNTRGIPATFIFNEKGELIKAHEGMDEYNTEAYVQLLK
ncbi:MAG: TlpA family protein disulfide reductase [Ginsengibacter sp.]